MISPTLAEALRRPLLTQRVLWVGYTASIAVYYVVVQVLSRGAPVAPALPEALSPYLWLAAGVVALAAVLYRRRVNSDAYLFALLARPAAPEELAKDGRTGRVDENYRRQIEAISESDRRFLALFSRLQTQLIVSLALHESIALLGLVLAFLHHDPASLVPFGAAAVALNLWVWPSRERLHERVAPRLLMGPA
jgi:hypothetical protein